MKNKILNPFLSFLLIFTLGQVTFSQDENKTSTFTEYKGHVKDSKSKDALVFADIEIVNTNIATITNNEGEFSIKVPNDINEAVLKISHLGYQELLLPVNRIKNKNKIQVKLNAQYTELSEVNIHTIKDAKALVKLMLKRKGENYISDNTLMTGFYRETIKKRNKNASLSEAVLEIYKQPYTSARNDKINLIKARKNVNYSRLDTLAVKLQGGPFSALYTDLIKYQEFIFTENELDDYEFRFEAVTKVNNKEVYVIDFYQKQDVLYPLYYGKLYVDVESFALTSATYKLNTENRSEASKMFIRKKPRKAKVYPTDVAYRVDYRVKDGLWYYSYGNVLLSFKVNWDNKLFNSVYTLSSEMAITDWKKGFDKKLIDKPLKPTTILIEEASGFSDPDFWGEYNIIEPEKSIESAIKKINKQLNKNKV